MQGLHLILPIHLHGTLAANATFKWTVPFNCTLKHVSAKAENDSDATLIVGISTDTDSILASTTIGDSGTPTEFTVSNWASTNPTGVLTKGQILVVTLDFDGAAGTAAQNVSIVLTLTEG